MAVHHSLGNALAILHPPRNRAAQLTNLRIIERTDRFHLALGVIAFHEKATNSLDALTRYRTTLKRDLLPRHRDIEWVQEDVTVERQVGVLHRL